MNREKLLRAVSEIILRHVPEGLDDPSIEAIVADIIRLLDVQISPENISYDEPSGRRIVITAIGRDQVGIIHAFSGILAERNVDILDVNQTILRGNFAMMMIVDPSSSNVTFQDLKSELKGRAEELGVQIFVQYEDLMRAVSRV